MQLKPLIRPSLDEAAYVPSQRQGASIVGCQVHSISRHLSCATGGLGDITRPTLADGEQVPLCQPDVHVRIFGSEFQ